MRSYLLADCELAGAQRRFRLDRVVEILPAGTAISRADAGEQQALAGRVEGEVWLRLEPAGHWIAESFGAAEMRDGGDGEAFARLDSPLLAPLVDAVLESAGAAEVLSPCDLRDTIVTVARDGAVRHTS